MKHVLSLLVGFALLFCVSPQIARAEEAAVAAVGVIASESAGDGTVTLARVNKTSSSTTRELLFLQLGGDIAALPLPATVLCEEETVDPWPMLYGCPVSWDTTSVDFSTPGRKRIFGTLQPQGTNFVLADAFDHTKVYYEVMVTAADMVPETVREIDVGIAPWVVAQGTPKENLMPPPDILFDCLAYTGEFGEYVPIGYTIDYAGVDTTKCGTYTAYVTPVLPLGLALPDGYTSLPVKIGVVVPDAIDLSAVLYSGFDDTWGSIVCKWLYTPQDWENDVQVEIAVGDGPWQEADYTIESGRKQYVNAGVIYPGNSLQVTLPLPQMYTDYYFRLRYESGRVSNVLHVRQDKEFIYDEGGIGGDRDGSSDSGSELPEIEQPGSSSTLEQASDKTNEPNQPVSQTLPSEKSNPIKERVTPTSSLYSGARLRKLLSLGDSTLLFEGQGVSVELSAEFLLGLNLSDSSTLEVRIERPEPTAFSLFIFVDGREIAELPDTLVRVPYEEGSGLALYDAAGTYLSDSIWEEPTKTVLCTVHHADVYYLRPAQKGTFIADKDIPNAAAPLEEDLSYATDQNKDNTAVLWVVVLIIAGGSIAVAAGLLLYRRWRRG